MNVSLNAKPIHLVENFLLDLCAKYLEVETFSKEIDIFDLGITSSALVYISSNIYEHFGCEVAIESFFENRTVTNIALAVLSILDISEGKILTEEDAKEANLEFWLDTISVSDDSTALSQTSSRININLPHMINQGENILDVETISSLLHMLLIAASEHLNLDCIIVLLNFKDLAPITDSNTSFPIVSRLDKKTTLSQDLLSKKVVGGRLRSLAPYQKAMGSINDYCKCEGMNIYSPNVLINFNQENATGNTIKGQNAFNANQAFVEELEKIVGSIMGNKFLVKEELDHISGEV